MCITGIFVFVLVSGSKFLKPALIESLIFGHLEMHRTSNVCVNIVRESKLEINNEDEGEGEGKQETKTPNFNNLWIGLMFRIKIYLCIYILSRELWRKCIASEELLFSNYFSIEKYIKINKAASKLCWFWMFWLLSLHALFSLVCSTLISVFHSKKKLFHFWFQPFNLSILCYINKQTNAHSA